MYTYIERGSIRAAMHSSKPPSPNRTWKQLDAKVFNFELEMEMGKFLKEVLNAIHIWKNTWKGYLGEGFGFYSSSTHKARHNAHARQRKFPIQNEQIILRNEE